MSDFDVYEGKEFLGELSIDDEKPADTLEIFTPDQTLIYKLVSEIKESRDSEDTQERILTSLEIAKNL